MLNFINIIRQIIKLFHTFATYRTVVSSLIAFSWVSQHFPGLTKVFSPCTYYAKYRLIKNFACSPGVSARRKRNWWRLHYIPISETLPQSCVQRPVLSSFLSQIQANTMGLLLYPMRCVLLNLGADTRAFIPIHSGMLP